MAGMLPGVGNTSRKRIHFHRQDDVVKCREPPLRERLEPPSTAVAAMDETAQRALHRLDKKLGYYSSSARSSKLQQNEGRGCNHTRSASKLLRRPWNFKLDRSKSHRKVCAVCLDDFQAEQQVMDLSCSHKYHSNCLMPWLAVHPHCPYCRTPVYSIS